MVQDMAYSRWLAKAKSVDYFIYYTENLWIALPAIQVCECQAYLSSYL